jgi:hypothetical protein
MLDDVALATSTSSPHVPSSGVVPEEAIRLQLRRILESPEFRTSKRCQDFLSFVVEQTLAGLPLKERTIGAGVFGRDASYNTNDDGIVRIKAGEVRKRLGLYYAAFGSHDDVEIELPVGSYVPTFSALPRNGHNADSLPFIESSNFPSATIGGGMRLLGVRGFHGIVWKIAWIIGLSAVIAVLATLAWRAYRPQSVLDQFWEPVLGGKIPVVVAASYAPVYYPSSYLGPPRTVESPRGSDFVLLTDQYVGGGDLLAAAGVAGMLGRMGRPFTIRIGNAVTFEDLRSGPAVLIGYSSTHWKDVTKGFRFYIDDDLGTIEDNGKPTDWFPHHLSSDFHTDEDYALVSRSFDGQTHTMIVLVSGFTQYGTEAAAEVITDPTLLAEALHDAPDGWQRKNLQLVLHMKVIANAPASPQIIASHYW